MKDFFDLLMDTVPHLDEPPYNTVALGTGQTSPRQRTKAPAPAATQPPAKSKNTAGQPARRKKGAVESVAGPPETALTVVRAQFAVLRSHNLSYCLQQPFRACLCRRSVLAGKCTALRPAFSCSIAAKASAAQSYRIYDLVDLMAKPSHEGPHMR